ncbi:Histone-lysine N-methyltransferase SETMAR [Anthophora retusa]
MSVCELHLRHCMLYEFKKGSTTTDTVKNICEVYGEHTLNLRKCQRWFSKFRKGDFDLSDEPRSGRPTAFNPEALKALIELEPQLTTDEIAERLGSSSSTVHRHLIQLGKVSKLGKWVPHELTVSNRIQRMNICASLRDRQNNRSFLDQIITGDEKWILYCNPKRKRQWLSPGQSSLQCPKPGLHPRKVLLCVWWDIREIIHFELLKQNQAVTAEIYSQQLERLQAALVKKRPSLVNRKGVLFHHDNARPHTARITVEKIKNFNWELLPHPPYSPDLAPSDYHLFRSMQHFLSGKNFNNSEDVKSALNEYFNSKSQKFSENGIRKLTDRWEKVIETDG